MADLTSLLDDADRIVATDLYPARCRTIVADLATALKALSLELDEAREENRWAYIQAALDDRETAAEAANAALTARNEALTKEPSEAAVWKMCAYLEPSRVCQKCPKTYEDPTYGKCQKACYGVAEETMQVAAANARLIAAAPTLATLYADQADELARVMEALDHLLDAITATDQIGDRVLTITGGTAALKWLIEAEDDARSLRDQCRAAGVPFFMKQMAGVRKSAMPPIPDDLMVREFPNV